MIQSLLVRILPRDIGRIFLSVPSFVLFEKGKEVWDGPFLEKKCNPNDPLRNHSKYKELEGNDWTPPTE